jgi:hypothetical protein
MWFHVYGFQNCKYNFEWPIVTLQNLNFTLFQNLKKPTIKPPKNGLLENNNNNNKLHFLQVQKWIFFFKESIFGVANLQDQKNRKVESLKEKEKGEKKIQVFYFSFKESIFWSCSLVA